MDEISFIAQRLLQVSPDALLVADEEGIIRFANAATSQLFGFSSEHLIGQSIDLLIPHRYRVRHRDHLSGFLEAPTSRQMGGQIQDLYAQRADGSEFLAGIRLSPFRDGGRIFVAAAVRDLTESRGISDALVAAREEADRSNRAKSRFLATASHDLRQPLQAIRLINASMHKLVADSSQLGELIRHQENAIDNATRLLNALLDISRLESGAIEPQFAPLALASALDDVVEEFMPAAVAKGLDLSAALSQTVISTDRMLLAQLLQNLVGNSIKYTEVGYVRIAQALDEDALVISVEDSGVGISADKVGRIFDEYYQVGPHGTPRVGVGLGLAIVREVSRLLGYSISVKSTLGQGTRVSVRVPAQRVLTDGPFPLPTPVDTARSIVAGACRLVLLEDNESVRNATELFLALEGFAVRSAGTVQQAEALLSEIKPGDVFITDYHLDGSLTGLDVLLKVRTQHQRDVPAVLMTGDLPWLLRVVKTPILRVRFLSKPVDTKALLSAIAELSAE